MNDDPNPSTPNPPQRQAKLLKSKPRDNDDPNLSDLNSSETTNDPNSTTSPQDLYPTPPQAKISNPNPTAYQSK